MLSVQDCSSLYRLRFRFMVFNAIFNNISVILWRSDVLVEETEYPEKTISLSQVTDKLHYMLFFLAHLAMNNTLYDNMVTSIRGGLHIYV
jgi:hypothetical protein